MLASTLSHQIQSQFSINIVDDAELNLNLTGQNFALLKKNDFDMSPIMNTLSDAHAVEYIDRKNQLALEEVKTAKIDIGEVSISGSSSRIEPIEPNVPWPIELNIPQLGPNAVTVEINYSLHYHFNWLIRLRSSSRMTNGDVSSSVE